MVFALKSARSTILRRYSDQMTKRCTPWKSLTFTIRLIGAILRAFSTLLLYPTRIWVEVHVRRQ